MFWSQIERGAIWLAAIVGGLVALGWIIRRVWRMFKRVDRLLHLVELVEKEMRPNGGSSLRDALDSVNSKLDAHLGEHAKAPVTINVAQGPPVPGG